jgi:hypothetical protein
MISCGKQDETDDGKAQNEDNNDAFPPVNPLKLRSQLQRYAYEDGTRRLGALSNNKAFRDVISGSSNRKTRASIDESCIVRTGKRKPTSVVMISSGPLSPKRNKAAIKRTYAPPEQYQHLHHLTDLLQPNLESKRTI